MSRTDVFDASGPAPGGKVIVKIGVDKNGKMLAGYADIRLEAGGYPESFYRGSSKMCFLVMTFLQWILKPMTF